MRVGASESIWVWVGTDELYLYACTRMYNKKRLTKHITAQLVGAVEYTDCISAEG